MPQYDDNNSDTWELTDPGRWRSSHVHDLTTGEELGLVKRNHDDEGPTYEAWMNDPTPGSDNQFYEDYYLSDTEAAQAVWDIRRDIELHPEWFV